MDGKLMNLNIFGEILWYLDSGLGSLINGNIDQVEFLDNNNGYRIIPSLDGHLYMYTEGEASIQRLPLTADSLLASSQKLGPDVVAGGKDIRSYGVDLDSGQVLYECGIEGCHQSPNQEDRNNSPTVVVHRTTRVIRAVDGQDGSERWNISVGDIEVSLPRGGSGYPRPEGDAPVIDLDYQVVASEGRVVAFERLRPENILWERKFDSPIAKVWEISDKIKEVSIFDANVMAGVDFVSHDGQPLANGHQSQALMLHRHYGPDPMIYFGVYAGVKYIIPMRDEVNRGTAIANLRSDKYKLFLASSSNFDDTTGHGGDSCSGHSCPSCSTDEVNSLILRDKYPRDMGWYLFKHRDTTAAGRIKHALSHHAAQVAGVGGPASWGLALLALYWKELVGFGALLIIPFQLWLFKRMYKFSLEEEQNDASSSTRSDSGTTVMVSVKSQASLDVDDHGTEDDYKSRYLDDFEPLRLLGRGGFGVVFEARKIMEDCNYAVKRISVVNSLAARERVTREVRALAKLDHPCIVRYYHSWFECPPAGWQQKTDKAILGQLKGKDGIPDASLTTSEATSATSEDVQASRQAQDKTTGVDGAHGFHTEGRFDLNFDEDSLSRTRNYPNLLDSDDGIVFEDSSNKPEWETLNTPAAVIDGTEIFQSQPENYSSDFVVFRDGDRNRTSSYPSKMKPGCSGDDGMDFIVFQNSKSGASDDGGQLNKQRFGYNPTMLHNESKNSIDYANAFDGGKNSERSSKDGGSDDLNSTNNSSSSEPRLMLRRRRRATELAKIASQDKAIDAASCKETGVQGQPRRIYLYIQMQLCADHTLRQWLRDTPQIGRLKPLVLGWFRQIVDAVRYVHSCKLIHRDLKPSNIFFTHTGSIKVGDFGLVTDADGTLFEDSCASLCKLAGQHTNDVGTQLYMSPEQIAGKSYTHKVDIFSLGLMFYELLVAFGTEMERIKCLQQAKNQRLPAAFKTEFPDDAEMVRWLVQRDPRKRPECQEILDAPFLNDSPTND